MQTVRLNQFQTTFAPREDRLVIKSNDSGANPVQLMLTRRLLRKLLPQTYAALEQNIKKTQKPTEQTASPHSETSSKPIKKGNSAQKAELPEAPDRTDTPAITATIDRASFKAVDAGVILTLIDSEMDETQFQIAMTYSTFESWLAIFQRICDVAEWPIKEFMPDQLAGDTQANAALH